MGAKLRAKLKAKLGAKLGATVTWSLGIHYRHKLGGKAELGAKLEDLP